MFRARIPNTINSLIFAWLCWALSGPAWAVEGNTRDVLVYKDGDRVQGRLIEKTDKIVVFDSDRFGVLRVLVDNAVVIKADVREPATALNAKPTDKEKEKAAQKAETDKLSPLEMFRLSVLTAKLGEFFGPWHGRFAFSLAQISNTVDQNSTGLDLTLQRKWKMDELQFKGRYDYSSTNRLTTTDMMKGEASWRHDFPQNYFTLYHPAVEWNRASFNNGVPNDYVQLQQEIGVGKLILSRPRSKVRVGVSENLFDVWNTTPGGIHTARTVESAFLEMELKLPWRMSLSQRGVYYYSFATGRDGWEDRIELSKKFTETLSTSIRQEIRRYNPDGTTQDYTRLKLLFGLDF